MLISGQITNEHQGEVSRWPHHTWARPPIPKIYMSQNEREREREGSRRVDFNQIKNLTYDHFITIIWKENLQFFKMQLLCE